MSKSEQETKVCPICLKELPLSNFGICRARKDGRNLYCKACIHKKVTESRKALKAYKSARKRYLTQQVALVKSVTEAEKFLAEAEGVKKYVAEAEEILASDPPRLSPIERVRDAVRKGARTQAEIAHQTKLSKDEIGDALASMLLWTHEIRTQVVEGTRMYFLNEEELEELSNRSERMQSETALAGERIIALGEEIKQLKTHTREMLSELSGTESTAA